MARDVSPGVRDWKAFYGEDFQERDLGPARRHRPRLRNWFEVREFVADRACDLYREDLAYYERIAEDVWHALWLRR